MEDDNGEKVRKLEESLGKEKKKAVYDEIPGDLVGNLGPATAAVKQTDRRLSRKFKRKDKLVLYEKEGDKDTRKELFDAENKASANMSNEKDGKGIDLNEARTEISDMEGLMDTNNGFEGSSDMSLTCEEEEEVDQSRN